MNTSIDWGAVGMCHLKRPKYQTYTNTTLLVLTEDHWSLALCSPQTIYLQVLWLHCCLRKGLMWLVGCTSFSV